MLIDLTVAQAKALLRAAYEVQAGSMEGWIRRDKGSLDRGMAALSALVIVSEHDAAARKQNTK